MRRTIVVVTTLVGSLTAACSSAPAQPPTPTPLATTAPVATSRPTAAVVATPRPATSSNSAAHADYKAITQPLLLPLGALIVAVRAGTPTTDYWLAQFNKSADGALTAIDGDTSDTANQLRTGIANIRARPNDLSTLEAARSTFLAIT